MSQCIRNKQHVPGGGRWKAKHPESGIVFEHGTLELFYKLIKQHHEVMNYPIGLDFEERVDSWICESMPWECGPCEKDIPKRYRRRRLNLSDVLRGTKVMGSVLWARMTEKLGGESPLVSPEEAEQRAARCVMCPFNVRVSMPCGGMCDELRRMIVAIAGNHSTKYDGRLQSCAVCKCWLSAAVWVRLDLQYEPLDDSQKEAYRSIDCWKNMKVA